MATLPPSSALNAPPPSPANPGGPGPGFGGMPSGPTPTPSGTQAPPDQSGQKGLIRMGAEIDRVLGMIAQAMPQGAAEFRQAKQLIQQGLAKGLAEAPAGAQSLSPTTAGSQFPGSMGTST